MKEDINLIIKGFLIGSADMVPGISGGTVALLTGIYERLIKGLSNLKLTNLYHRQGIKNIDLAFFIPLGIGIILAVIVTPQIITWLLNDYPAGFYALLFGLIWGSLTPLTKKIKPRSSNFLLLLIGFFLAFYLTGLDSLLLEHSILIIFFSGVLAFSAMILPGISGSFVLLALNQYEYMLTVLRDIRITEIIVFLIGGLFSLLLFSKIINIFIKRYYRPTIIFLTGLMLGSLRLPAELIIENHQNILETSLPLILGFLIIIIFENKHFLQNQIKRILL